MYYRMGKVYRSVIHLFVDKTTHTTNHNALSPNRVQQTKQSVRSAALKTPKTLSNEVIEKITAL